MNKQASKNQSEENRSLNEYSPAQELINNLPYIVMAVFGAAVFVLGFENLAWRWIGAGAYLIYAVAGALWIMVFVCPYCSYWNTRACPCGYGRIAVRFRDKQSGDCFNEKFKKHIPVIVPLWFIPVIVGLLLIIRSFSWLLLAVLIVFAIDAFIILPLYSKKHGCKQCPQRDECPWMAGKSSSA